MNSSEQDSQQLNETQTSRMLQIPLMAKRQNMIEKYVNGFRLPTLQDSSSPDYHPRRRSMLSSNASKIIFEDKYAPDSRVTKFENDRSYIQYSPLKEQSTEDRIDLLDRVEMQYNRLKKNFSKNKDPYLSKFTIPIRQRVEKEKKLDEGNNSYSMEEIKKQLKKLSVDEKGRKFFPDLQIIHKDRSKLLQQISRGKKIISLNETNQVSEYQTKLIAKKMKSLEQKKKKMMQNKGLHWNVYYEMMALNKNEKSKIKDGSAKFGEFYGVDL